MECNQLVWPYNAAQTKKCIRAHGHIVCKLPPPSANKCVTCARSVRVCACVCALCARVRAIRAGARAVRARCTRALYLHTVRARCTRCTRTVRPDCTQKVCAKICCVLFNICCVFFGKSYLFFSVSAVLFCTYGPRVRWSYGTARARAPCTYARRARAPRTARARAVRTVCANRTRGLYGKSVCAKFCCVFSLFHAFFFKSLLPFFKSAVFFSHIRSAQWPYGTARARTVCAYVRRARVEIPTLIDSNVRTRRFSTSIHLRARAAPHAGVGVPQKGFGRFSEIR